MDLSTLAPHGVRSQLLLADNVIREAACVRPRYMRPPYGAVSESAASVITSMGYRIINWNLDSNDWSLREVQCRMLTKTGRAATPARFLTFRVCVPLPSATPDVTGGAGCQW